MTRASEYCRVLVASHGKDKVFAPVKVWTVTNDEPELVEIVRLRAADNSSDTSYADCKGMSRSVSTHYLFPSRPSLREFRDDFGPFRDWACD